MEFTKEQLIDHCKSEIEEWKESIKLFKDDFEYPFIQSAVLEIALKALTDGDKLAAAERRIAELEAEKAELRPVGVMSEKAFYRLEQSESRFIALWPRPGIHLPRKRPLDSVVVYARVVASAGIGKGE